MRQIILGANNGQDRPLTVKEASHLTNTPIYYRGKENAPYEASSHVELAEVSALAREAYPNHRVFLRDKDCQAV